LNATIEHVASSVVLTKGGYLGCSGTADAHSVYFGAYAKDGIHGPGAYTGQGAQLERYDCDENGNCGDILYFTQQQQACTITLTDAPATPKVGDLVRGTFTCSLVSNTDPGGLIQVSAGAFTATLMNDPD
jgi:hypothetical protein